MQIHPPVPLHARSLYPRGGQRSRTKGDSSAEFLFFTKTTTMLLIIFIQRAQKPNVTDAHILPINKIGVGTSGLISDLLPPPPLPNVQYIRQCVTVGGGGGC
jgi:hypothetical protein